MKTVKHTYTDEATGREIEIEAVCVSREGLENIERVCNDADGSINLTDITDTDNEIPAGWTIIVAEDTRSQGDWSKLRERYILENTLKACEPSLAEDDLWDVISQGVRMAEVYICVDDTIKNAPKLDLIDEASKHIIEYGKTHKFESMSELATVGNKYFSQTALARSMNLSVKYNPDEEKIYLDGRPRMARTDKIDYYFCMSAFMNLNLAEAACGIGKDTEDLPILYFAWQDEIILDTEAN